MTNELPEGYEVVEISDGCGGYEYQVQKTEDKCPCVSCEENPTTTWSDEDFDWCNDSGYNDVFDAVNEFWDEEA
jgi:hypothetical protein